LQSLGESLVGRLAEAHASAVMARVRNHHGDSERSSMAASPAKHGDEIRRHPGLVGIEGREVRDRASETRSLVTKSVKVTMARSGTHRLRYRGSSTRIQRGVVVVVEPGEVHAAGADGGPYSADVMLLDPHLVSSSLGNESTLLPPGLFLKDSFS